MTTSVLKMQKHRGKKIQHFCKIALENKLAVKGGVQENLFQQAIESYVGRRMSRWTCGLTYLDGQPVAAFISTNHLISVYVKPKYRRRGIGRQLVDFCKDDVVVLKACTDRREGKAFFRALGIINN